MADLPQLDARTVCIDLDGTVWQNEDRDPERAAIEPGAIAALYALRAAGWRIVLYTGRHFNWSEHTVAALTLWRVPYDQLVFGKPPARYYIDDCAIRYERNWPELVNQIGSPLEETCPR